MKVLKQIIERNLTHNAQESGAYFVERLKAKARKLGLDPNKINGVGLLMDGGPHLDQLTKVPVDHYRGRMTPPITTSKDEINKLIGE